MFLSKSYEDEQVWQKKKNKKKLNIYLRNKSWKPECVGSFNMDWWI